MITTISSRITDPLQDYEVRYRLGTWYGNSWTDIRVGIVYLLNNYIAGGGGHRFLNINIPVGSKITEAHITFTSILTSPPPAQTICSKIRGERNVNPAIWSNITNYFARARTINQITWDIIHTAYNYQTFNTPDIKDIIQEIIDLPGWVSGNSIVIWWDDHDDRTAHTDNLFQYIDGSSSWHEAELWVTFDPPLPYNYSKLGIVIPLGSVGQWNDVSVFYPCPLYHDGLFWLYYSAHDGTSFIKAGLAISEDGINFIDKGVIIPLGNPGDIDNVEVEPAGVFIEDGIFHLYLNAYDGTTHRIALACSEDGIHFIKQGVVIPIGSLGEADSFWAMHYLGFTKIDGTIRGAYTAHKGLPITIGGLISEDGYRFVKLGNLIVDGSVGQWDDIWAGTPWISFSNGVFNLIYQGKNSWGVSPPNSNRIGLACSKDGIYYSKKGTLIPLGATGQFDAVHTEHGGIIINNGLYYLYYRGHNGSSGRIGLAISESGF